MIFFVLFITAALKALQVLSSSVQTDFNESFVNNLPSINESCFGDSQRFPHTKFPR